jgi:SAM-dependent methyltransferase
VGADAETTAQEITMSADHDQHEHEHTDGEQQYQERPRWDADFWDERYSASEQVWSGHVNAALSSEAESLAPGRALDVGCGEGGDALWLAERGWDVLGVDVSQVALGRAAARADEVGLADRTRWELRDLLAWSPPVESFDLVCAAFIHLPTDDRRTAYAGLAAAVAPGGSLLIVAHHPSDVGLVPRPPYPDLMFTEDDLVADLATYAGQWDVVTAEARPRPGRHPEGHDVTLHDTVLRAVRR